MKVKKLVYFLLFIFCVMAILQFGFLRGGQSIKSEYMFKEHVTYAGSVKQNFEKERLRFVVMSDTHGLLIEEFWKSPPEGDVFLFSGDFSNYRTDLAGEIEKFNEWMMKLPYKYKFVVSGNHEIDPKYPEGGPAAAKEFQEKLTCCVYLHEKSFTLLPSNVKIYGTSYSPNMWNFLKDFHPDWESYDDKFYFRSEEELMQIYSRIPKDTNVLLTHIPPLNIMDHQVFDRGSKSLRYYVENILMDLKVHVFGHVHHQSGHQRIQLGDRDILFINTSINDKEMNDEEKKETMTFMYVFDYFY